MQKLSSDAIRKKALWFNQEGAKWHFHILTPACKFNTSQQYAFVLEGPDGNAICHSEQPPAELGKELAPLMHKAKVLDSNTTDDSYQPSETIKKIIARATQLNEQGVRWHHHVIFENCQYSEGKSKFTLIFEDPENGTIEQPSNEEPINDLKQIEPLFYSQQ